MGVRRGERILSAYLIEKSKNQTKIEGKGGLFGKNSRQNGPLSRRGCTRSRRPKNGPKTGIRAAQTAIYGRGRGPISSQRPAAVERLRLCARRGRVAAWSVLRSPGRRPGRRAAAWSAQGDGRAGRSGGPGAATKNARHRLGCRAFFVFADMGTSSHLAGY